MTICGWAFAKEAMRGERRKVLPGKLYVSISKEAERWRECFDSDDILTAMKVERETYFMPLELPHLSQ